MKNATIFTYVFLFTIALYQTACSSYSLEQVLPEPTQQARLGGGPLIVLEDPCALPEYDSESYNATSSNNGCLTVQETVSATGVDVVIAYKPSSENNWEGILLEGTYSNGTVLVNYTLPCLHTNSEYDIKVISLTESDAMNVQTGAAATSCTNCQ